MRRDAELAIVGDLVNGGVERRDCRLPWQLGEAGMVTMAKNASVTVSA